MIELFSEIGRSSVKNVHSNIIVQLKISLNEMLVSQSQENSNFVHASVGEKPKKPISRRSQQVGLVQSNTVFYGN